MVNATPPPWTISPPPHRPRWSEAAAPQVFSGLGPCEPVIYASDLAGAGAKERLVRRLLASLSGWLYAHLLRFVNPTPFSINAGIEYLFMAVVGGAASVWGAVIGAEAVIALWQGKSHLSAGIRCAAVICISRAIEGIDHDIWFGCAIRILHGHA